MNWRSFVRVDCCTILAKADPDLLTLRIHDTYHCVSWFMIAGHVLVKKGRGNCSNISFQDVSNASILWGLGFLIIEENVCLLGMPIHIIARKIRVVIESCKIWSIVNTFECVVWQRAKSQVQLYSSLWWLNHILYIIHVFSKLSDIPEHKHPRLAVISVFRPLRIVGFRFRYHDLLSDCNASLWHGCEWAYCSQITNISKDLTPRFTRLINDNRGKLINSSGWLPVKSS